MRDLPKAIISSSGGVNLDETGRLALVRARSMESKAVYLLRHSDPIQQQSASRSNLIDFFHSSPKSGFNTRPHLVDSAKVNTRPCPTSLSQPLAIWDLLNHILSFVPESALLQCAMVNKLFRAVAFRRLYRSPSFSSRKQFHRFRETLLFGCTSSEASSYPSWVHFVRELDLTSFRHRKQVVNNESVVAIIQHPHIAHALRSANLSGCTQITNTSVTELLKQCTHLHELKLNDLDQLTDSAFIDACTEPSQRLALQALEVNGCKQLTDATIDCLGNRCLRLHRLSVAFAKHVRGRAVVSLFHLQPHMTDLHLRSCGRWTSEDLLQLSFCAYRLRNMTLECNYGTLSKESLQAFLRRTLLEHVRYVLPMVPHSDQVWHRPLLLNEEEKTTLLSEVASLKVFEQE